MTKQTPLYCRNSQRRGSSLRRVSCLVAPDLMAPNSHIPPMVERDLVYRRVGLGPTSPAPEQVSAWLDETFKPTQSRAIPQGWVLNLEDTAMTAEALYELV